MSSRSKGSQYEREFEKLLLDLGWVTQRVKGSTMFNKNVDFFGHWDIISFDGACWMLVQVKTDYRNEEYERLQKWFEENKPPCCYCVYAIRKKGIRGMGKWSIVEVGKTVEVEELPIETKKIIGGRRK